jgi:hypothetical protein
MKAAPIRYVGQDLMHSYGKDECLTVTVGIAAGMAHFSWDDDF